MSWLHVRPSPGSKQAEIKFKQYKYCTKAPFVIEAEFESILGPSGRQVKQTTYIQQHKVCAAAAILTSSCYNFDQRTVMKVEENALAEFLDSLIVWEAEIVAILRTNRAMKRLSARQQKKYDNATRCYICRQEFVESEAKGPKYVTTTTSPAGLSAPPTASNLERPVSFKIPMFFHNFRGYDAHLTVHEFGKRPDREIKVIGQNMEKYLQVEWGKNMVFRNSLQFLPASLEQLAASHAKVGNRNFQNLHDVVIDVYPEGDVELLERNGVFCYDYLDSLVRLDEPALSPRVAFFNKRGGVECSEADYAHAQHVWKNFHCQSL